MPDKGSKEQQQEIVQLQLTVRALKQQVAALQGRLDNLLKDLDTRKKFFSGIKL